MFLYFFPIQSYYFSIFNVFYLYNNTTSEDEARDESTFCFEERATELSEMQADIDRLLELDHIKQKEAAALFILKMRAIRGVSQVAINDVVDGASEIFAQTVVRLKAGVRHKLAEIGIDESHSKNFEEDVFGTLTDPFAGLETNYLQEKYFKENFNVPVSLLINA